MFPCFKHVSGTDKYEGASGGGTYVYDSLTDSLFAGTFKGTIIVP